MNKIKLFTCTAIASSAMTFSNTLLATDDLPSYTPVNGVSGKLNSVGSDTLAELVTNISEKFKSIYPNIQIEIQASGSSTAPTALIEGTGNIGPMSRKMKSQEIQRFHQKHGYPPTAIPVAIDALSVFVNMTNPIDKITIKEIDAVFSKNNSCGYVSSISTWSDLGVEGSLSNQRLQLFGRNSVSGTYGYFKEVALCKGDYKDNVNERPGSSAVVLSIAEAPNGIGYSGMGYITESVKAISISKNGKDYFEPTEENVISGDYPLARFLYIYVNKAPNQPLDPMLLEFFKYTLSKEGQEVAESVGFVPLPASVVNKTLEELGGS